MIKKIFKIIIYFLQSILIYIFFIIGRIFGIKISRRIFSHLFFLIGPIFKSSKIIKKNLKILASTNMLLDEKKIISSLEKLWHDFYRIYISRLFL